MPALANPFQSLPILYQNTAGYFFSFTLHQIPNAHTLPPIHLEHIMPLDAFNRLPQILRYPMPVIRMGCFMLMFPKPYFQSNFCPAVFTFATEYILLPKSTGFRSVVSILLDTTEQNPVFHLPHLKQNI